MSEKLKRKEHRAKDKIVSSFLNSALFGSIKQPSSHRMKTEILNQVQDDKEETQFFKVMLNRFQHPFSIHLENKGEFGYNRGYERDRLSGQSGVSEEPG